jgi:hypothetical protein
MYTIWVHGSNNEWKKEGGVGMKILLLKWISIQVLFGICVYLYIFSSFINIILCYLDFHESFVIFIFRALLI